MDLENGGNGETFRKYNEPEVPNTRDSRSNNEGNPEGAHPPENGYGKSNGSYNTELECVDPSETNPVDGKEIMNDMDVEKEKGRIWKNIFLISVAFLFNFTAFQTLSRLQSSIHPVEGLGTITSSIVYGTLMLSCMFLPKFVIHFLGHKWTIFFSFIGYVLYMAANGYALWGTLGTASVLVGLCAAPLWTAQCSYFTIIGNRYAKLNKENEDAAVSRFFGIFFMFFQISGIIGSIISATVLMPSNKTSTIESYEFCGANDCPYNNVSSTESIVQPNETAIWILVGIFLFIGISAMAIVGLFVDPIPKELLTGTFSWGEIEKTVVATFLHLRHKEQLIMIPLTMYSGFEQAFFNAEFSKSYISCSLGIWKVGLVTIPYAVCNAAMSLGGGHIAKYIGRIPIFTFGMCVDLCTQFTLRFWNPNADQEYVLYILACMYGMTDGIWQTQINTVYSLLFPNDSEAAFSNYRMWESLGFIIAFAYSSFICTSVKSEVVISVLLAGMAGYYTVEFLHRKELTSVVERLYWMYSGQCHATSNGAHCAEVAKYKEENIYDPII